MTTGFAVTRIEIMPIRLPLIEPFVIAYATYTHTHSVLVRISLANGVTGWGESTPDPDVTGETWDGVFEALQVVSPALIGLDARRIDAAHQRIDGAIGSAPAATAALDIALHDAVASAAGLPVWALLAGREAGPLTISRVVSMGNPDAMARDAMDRVALGFRTIKLKVGDADHPDLDAQRILAVRQAVGPDIHLKVDANQGWRSAGVAIEAIRQSLRAAVDYYEQPVDKADLDGLSQVRRETGAPIMVDEGCHGPEDALRVVKNDAADFINIKLMKCGGLRRGVAIDAIARGAGLGTQVGTMVESSIASAAGLHLAAALSNVATVEMGGPLMHAADIGDARAWYSGPSIILPDRPGLGITVDERRLQELQTEHVVIG